MENSGIVDVDIHKNGALHNATKKSYFQITSIHEDLAPKVFIDEEIKGEICRKNAQELQQAKYVLKLNDSLCLNISNLISLPANKSNVPRFKVVKIPSQIPYTKGRWLCLDSSYTSLNSILPTKISQPEKIIALENGQFSQKNLEYQNEINDKINPVILANKEKNISSNIIEQKSGNVVCHLEAVITENTNLFSYNINEKISSLTYIPNLSNSPLKSPPTISPNELYNVINTEFSGSLVELASNTQAIDNKIELAMDLVKSHLRHAVQCEMDILREQVKELCEINKVLQRENLNLRSQLVTSSTTALPLSSSVSNVANKTTLPLNADNSSALCKPYTSSDKEDFVTTNTTQRRPSNQDNNVTISRNISDLNHNSRPLLSQTKQAHEYYTASTLTNCSTTEEESYPAQMLLQPTPLLPGSYIGLPPFSHSRPITDHHNLKYVPGDTAFLPSQPFFDQVSGSCVSCCSSSSNYYSDGISGLAQHQYNNNPAVLINNNHNPHSKNVNKRNNNICNTAAPTTSLSNNDHFAQSLLVASHHPLQSFSGAAAFRHGHPTLSHVSYSAIAPITSFLNQFTTTTTATGSHHPPLPLLLQSLNDRVIHAPGPTPPSNMPLSALSTAFKQQQPSNAFPAAVASNNNVHETYLDQNISSSSTSVKEGFIAPPNHHLLSKLPPSTTSATMIASTKMMKTVVKQPLTNHLVSLSSLRTTTSSSSILINHHETNGPTKYFNNHTDDNNSY